MVVALEKDRSGWFWIYTDDRVLLMYYMKGMRKRKESRMTLCFWLVLLSWCHLQGKRISDRKLRVLF